jgi:hypothetical protein
LRTRGPHTAVDALHGSCGDRSPACEDAVRRIVVVVVVASSSATDDATRRLETSVVWRRAAFNAS